MDSFLHLRGMYDQETITRLRTLITRNISKLTDHVIELEDLTRPIAPDVAIGRISRMDAINNKSVNEAALRQSREKLQALHHALDHIGSPTFGTCIRCNQLIPLGRLMVMPEATRCLRCS